MKGTIEVTVGAIRALTPLVREFTFEPVDGELPVFSAGSHVQVHLPAAERALQNAYSLVGRSADGRGYRIAVRLQETSRGGSRHLHERVRVGQVLRISSPANLFPIHSQARHHLMVAGGIGITPFMAYIDALEQRGAAFELHYALRAGLTDAYAAALRERLGDRLHLYDALAGKPLDIRAVLTDRPIGTHVYCCGPERLIEGVRDRARALGWHDNRVHFEAFAAPEPGLPFEVELVRSRRRIAVAHDQSLLEALEQSGLDVPNLCRNGVCGQCATPHLGDAEIDHRDHFLTPQERCSSLMPCVSRGGRTPVRLDI